MKKIILTFALGLITVSGFAQKRDIVLIPHIIMENGTMISTTLVQNTQQIVLDIEGNDANETVLVTVEREGQVVDAQISYMENDRIVVDTDVELDGKCSIVLRQRNEEVEVAETTDTTEE